MARRRLRAPAVCANDLCQVTTLDPCTVTLSLKLCQKDAMALAREEVGFYIELRPLAPLAMLPSDKQSDDEERSDAQ